MPNRSDLVIETFPIGTLGCNCSLIYSNVTRETLVIDPGNDLNTFLKQIHDRGLKVRKLIHTHAHFDHIGRSHDIAQTLGCTLELHKDDLELYQALEHQGLIFGMEVGKPGHIDHFFEDEEPIGIESEGLQNLLKTIHTPGHTQGSCCFFAEDLDTPILFSGDTLFKGSIGRTDLPGGDFDQIMISLKRKIINLPDETIVISGHGPKTKIAFEKKQNPFLI